MRRSILFLMLGIFGTALIGSAVSVFLFHDVDRDKVADLGGAMAGLCVESVLFALIIGVGVGVLTWLGRRLFRRDAYAPRAMLGLLLGIGVSVLQYPWDLVMRKAVPQFASASLGGYIALAIVFCSVVLLRDRSVE